VPRAVEPPEMGKVVAFSRWEQSSKDARMRSSNTRAIDTNATRPGRVSWVSFGRERIRGRRPEEETAAPV
jgi:hypothetical protein